jgi:hypothetical protein
MFQLGTSTLTHLLASYGYLAVLLFVAIESTGSTGQQCEATGRKHTTLYGGKMPPAGG